MTKELTFVGTHTYDEGNYINERYMDENGKFYDFVYEFKQVKTQNADGNWVEFDEEYEVV